MVAREYGSQEDKEFYFQDMAERREVAKMTGQRIFQNVSKQRSSKNKKKKQPENQIVVFKEAAKDDLPEACGEVGSFRVFTV